MFSPKTRPTTKGVSLLGQLENGVKIPQSTSLLSLAPLKQKNIWDPIFAKKMDPL